MNGAAEEIAKLRAETKRKILELMGRLAGEESLRDGNAYYRQMLERIAGDRSALDAANKAVEQMDEDESRIEVVRNAVDEYEATKREIAMKLLEKLG